MVVTIMKMAAPLGSDDVTLHAQVDLNDRIIIKSFMDKISILILHVHFVLTSEVVL